MQFMKWGTSKSTKLGEINKKLVNECAYCAKKKSRRETKGKEKNKKKKKKLSKKLRTNDAYQKKHKTMRLYFRRDAY